MRAGHGSYVAGDAGTEAARRSLWLLAWLPVSPIVGFVAASWLLSDDWPLAQVIPLAVVLAAPFAAGAWFALRAVRAGQRRAWLLLAAHVVLVLVAVIVPISESLSSG